MNLQMFEMFATLQTVHANLSTFQQKTHEQITLSRFRNG